MFQRTRKFLGMLLAVAVLAGSIQFPGAGSVLAQEVISGNDLVSENGTTSGNDSTSENGTASGRGS